MKKVHILLTAATFLLPVSSISAQRVSYLRAIEVFVSGAPDEGQPEAGTPKRFTSLSGGRISVDLELGETIEGQEVVLHPRPGSSVSPAEIRAAVHRAGGASWARMVRDVKGPHDYPSAVSVSKISLRVSVTEGGRWKVINTLDFLVPMGC